MTIHILPESIDFDAFKSFMEWYHEQRAENPTAQLDLYCLGHGGEITYADAIANVIRTDGNFRGILHSHAFSSHSVIFCACNDRRVYLGASLIIHAPIMGVGKRSVTIQELKANLEQGDIFVDYTAYIYHTACEVKTEETSFKAWRKRVLDASPAPYPINYQQMIEWGMAKPYGQS